MPNIRRKRFRVKYYWLAIQYHVCLHKLVINILENQPQHFFEKRSQNLTLMRLAIVKSKLASHCLHFRRHKSCVSPRILNCNNSGARIEKL